MADALSSAEADSISQGSFQAPPPAISLFQPRSDCKISSSCSFHAGPWNEFYALIYVSFFKHLPQLFFSPNFSEIRPYHPDDACFFNISRYLYFLAFFFAQYFVDNLS